MSLELLSGGLGYVGDPANPFTIYDESVSLGNRFKAIDFIGAGITVIPNPLDASRAQVTVPGAAAVTGWQDDGVVVRLVTLTDNVAIGVATMAGAEKLRVVGDARVEGDFYISGDLTVDGTTTTVNSTVVDVGDRVVHLNHSTGVVAIPALITGVGVHRGATAGPVTRDHAALLWVNDSDVVDPSAGTGYWQFAAQTGGDDATVGTELDLHLRDLVASGAITFGGSSPVPTTRTLTAGAGLTGGGDLSADRSFAVGAGVGVTVNADDVAVNTAYAFDWQADHQHDKTGVAAGAATQVRSYRSRYTASMWTGAAEAERDIDLYALPSSVAVDESGGAIARLRIDYEGVFLLEIGGDSAAGATQGPTFYSNAANGTNNGFDFRVKADITAANTAFQVVDNNDAAPTALFRVLGDGLLTSPGGIKFGERATVPAAPGAGFGTYWVKNDAPSTPYFTGDDAVDHLLAYASAVVPTTRLLSALGGLVGGGDLSVDRSFAVGAGIGITVNADDVAVNTSYAFDWQADHQHDKTGIATGAATQVRSYRSRYTASMWTGAAEVERDWDVYAVPSTVASGEDVAALAILAIDFEGSRILELMPASASGAFRNVTFRNTAVDVGVAAFEFRASVNFAAGNPVFDIADNETTLLWRVYGDGAVGFLGGAVDAPSITHVGDPDTGGWFPAADIFAVTLGGVLSAWFQTDVTTLYSASASGVGMELRLRQNSASPLATDVVGNLTYYGEDDASAEVQYGGIETAITVVAAATRSGRVTIKAAGNAAMREGIRVEGSGAAAALGFYGVAAATRPAALTQTYATADRTHADFTSADIGAFTGGVVGFLDAAERDGIRTQFNALRADVADLKQFVNALVDDMQTLGLEQ